MAKTEKTTELEWLRWFEAHAFQTPDAWRRHAWMHDHFRETVGKEPPADRLSLAADHSPPSKE